MRQSFFKPMIVEVKNEYNYLLNLAVYNFTLEKVQELETEIQKKNERKK